MKTKNLVFLSCILLFSVGCSDDNDLPNGPCEAVDILPLSDIKWKLAGLVDVQAGTLQELEPKDCADCYTLSFKTDSTGFGRSSTNSMAIHLNKMPPLGIMTEVGELGNGYQFVDAFRSVYSYVREDDELKFFYKKDDKPYYLLYRLVEQNVNDWYVVGYDRCGGVTINEKTGKANGYYIISADLKDTLLTYNFPKDIFDFPAQCFSLSTVTPIWFPDEFRKSFKVHIDYEIASEEELVYSICTANILIQPVNSTQIIIKSAIKSE